MSIPHQIIDSLTYPKVTTETRFCPCCRKDWRGLEIPEVSRKYYGPNTTHFSRLLGIEIQGHYDGVSIWQCPDCLETFPARPGVSADFLADYRGKKL